MIDDQDNILLIGSVQGPVVFDTETITSTGRNLLLAKYDKNGTLLWARNSGGQHTVGMGIAINGANEIFVVGSFLYTATFGANIITSTGSTDIFVGKYTSNGIPIWINQAGGTGEDYGNALALDSQENLLVTGEFRYTATFGTEVVTSTGSSDIFTAKYTPEGLFTWVTTHGSGVKDQGLDITVNNNDDIYISGSLSHNIFVAKYISSTGEIIDTQEVGSTDPFEKGNGIIADHNGDLLVTGLFGDMVNFGSEVFVTKGGFDVFVTKIHITDDQTSDQERVYLPVILK